MKSWLKLVLLCTLTLVVLPVSGCVSQSQYDEIESRYISLQSEHETLRSDYASMQNAYSDLQSEHEIINRELAELKDESTSLQEKLTVLESKYPPRLFKDTSELEGWLAKQPDPVRAANAGQLYKHARDLQKAAAEDGYIISAVIDGPDEEGYYYVWCSAVLADHSYYQWDPDTDEIYFGGDVRYF